MKALDLFCGAGGVSVGLARAGFEVVGVDRDPRAERHWRRGMERHGGTFVCADALTFDLGGYDFIWASPPCQAHSALRHLRPDRAYPDLIAATRERLQATGTLYAIENVPGAPLSGAHPLVLLCGSMFGLQTPDGRAELRRHRWFELSWHVLFRPQCQHGHAPESLSVTGTGMGVGGKTRWRERQTLTVTGHSYQGADAHSRRKVLCVAGGKAMSGGMMTPRGELKRRRALSITGHTAQTNVVRNQVRETFPVDDARAAMGIDWMPMQHLSQAIPPAYAEWIARQALQLLENHP